jgi:hypothetical protein
MKKALEDFGPIFGIIFRWIWDGEIEPLGGQQINSTFLSLNHFFGYVLRKMMSPAHIHASYLYLNIFVPIFVFANSTK